MLFAHHFQMLKEKVYLLPESLVQLSDLGLDFEVIILVSVDIYSNQLIILLKPDFNCGNNSELSWVDILFQLFQM